MIGERFLQQRAGAIINVFEPIWAKVNAAVPARDNHTDISDVHHWHEILKIATSAVLSVWIMVAIPSENQDFGAKKNSRI